MGYRVILLSNKELMVTVMRIEDTGTLQMVLDRRDVMVFRKCVFNQKWVAEHCLTVIAAENVGYPLAEGTKQFAAGFHAVPEGKHGLYAVTCDLDISDEAAEVFYLDGTAEDVEVISVAFVGINFLLFAIHWPVAALFLDTLDIRFLAGDSNFFSIAKTRVVLMKATSETLTGQ